MEKIIKNNIWYRQACNSKAYYLFTPSRAATKSLGSPYGFWLIRNNKYFDWFCPEEYFVKTSEKIIKLQKKNPRFIDKKIEKYNKALAKIQRFYSEYEKMDIEGLSYQEIRAAILKLDSLVYNFWLIAYICDYFDPTGEEILRREIKEANVNLKRHEVAVLLRTKKLHYAQKERLEMLLEALKLKQRKITRGEAEIFLKKHANKYFYIENSWESTKILRLNDFDNRFEELLKKTPGELKLEINDLNNNWEKEHQKIFKKYKIKKDLQAVFRLFRSISYLRDVRKGSTLLSNYFFDIFYKRLADFWNIPFETFNVALINDLLKDHSASEYKKILEKRKGFVMEAYLNGKSRFLFAKETEKMYSIFNKLANSEIKEIKGSCASPGKKKGLVRVVMGETHFSKFNEGEILVAPMTRPEYMSLIKKAAAIITDEGGVTCHAAIVSRELKKPCVIGTKIATKVLKDGDVVEVDANKGTVKKLN